MPGDPEVAGNARNWPEVLVYSADPRLWHQGSGCIGTGRGRAWAVACRDSSPTWLERTNIACCAPPRTLVGDGAPIQVAISGYAVDTAHSDAKAAAGVWFGADDGRNQGVLIPASQTQDKVNGEFTAAIMCLQYAPVNSPLHIVVGKSSAAAALAKNLAKWEDKGWIGVPNRVPLQKLAVSMRARKGATVIVKASAKPEKDALNNARRLTKQAIATTLGTRAKAVAYKGIKERRETTTRKATTRNMKLVREAGAPRAHSLPSRRAVWKALRHKDLSKQIKTFFWMGKHGAHRVGAYWEHLPGFEE
ncbi:hypothetical protein B0H13DRAFT_1866016 [Mycena leptocephala]|nr:hypothetical protein B0H13DRAFT_1866016 [Mycena leptocephala]